MNTMKKFPLIFAAGLGLVLAACAGSNALQENPVDMGPLPLHGYVTDVPEFERYIATRPGQEEFRKRYPDVTLVMPWDIATKELRMNKSRYFAQVDEKGKIIGGKFQ